jgi:hypothetical protein
VLEFVCVVAVNEAGECRGMPVDIRIHKQSAVGLLVELSKFILFVILIFEVVDE